MALWLLVLRGVITPGELPPAVWHGHEMLFGFAVAVIAGFLLTAAQNWTGIRTRRGGRWPRCSCCGWRVAWAFWFRA